MISKYTKSAIQMINQFGKNLSPRFMLLFQWFMLVHFQEFCYINGKVSKVYNLSNEYILVELYRKALIVDK